MIEEVSIAVMDKLDHASVVATDVAVFHKDKHVSYWLRCLRTPLPHHYTGSDANRISLAFFIISALDLLGILFTRTTAEEREDYASWVYQCQHPQGGFRGFPNAASRDGQNASDDNLGCATMSATFFALSVLCVLEDDFTRVNRRACLTWLKKMQRADGSFGELLDNEERVRGGLDSRFGYCAMGIRWVLHGRSGKDQYGCLPDIDAGAMIRCVQRAKTFDGGLADEPFHEAHAGFTFCGIGALALDERLQECQQNGQSSAINTNGMSPGRRPKVGDVLGDLDKTIRWLVARLTTLLDEDESTMDDEDDETVADIETTPLQTPSHFAAGSDAESFTKLRSYPIDAPSQIAHSTPLMQGQRQEDLDRMTGFNGRSNKVADTCYAFWVCGSLSLLGSLRLTEPMPIRRYLLERTQHVIAGGFGKLPGDPPDIYHSYLALAALALIDGNKDDDPVIGPDIEKGQNEVAAESNSQKETKADDRKERNLRALDPLMCFSVRARKWLENLEWHRVP